MSIGRIVTFLYLLTLAMTSHAQDKSNCRCPPGNQSDREYIIGTLEASGNGHGAER